MPRHLISDVHEWINEVPTVPTHAPAKPQPWERAWNSQRGKKTLLSFTLVAACGAVVHPERSWELGADVTPALHALLCLLGQYVGRMAARVRGHVAMGSLAGAAYLLYGNAGAQRGAQWAQNTHAERKGKSSLDTRAQ